MKPAQTFPLGDYLAEEMKVRGWGWEEAFMVSMICPARGEELLSGATATEEECRALAETFGVSPELFINLNKERSDG